MLRETGMSIADIRVIAELSRTPGTEAERLVLFRAHRERVLEEIARTQRHLAAIDTKIAAYEAAVEGTNE
jgi:DNA-binding transcriptional MerR regulator